MVNPKAWQVGEGEGGGGAGVVCPTPKLQTCGSSAAAVPSAIFAARAKLRRSLCAPKRPVVV